MMTLHKTTRLTFASAVVALLAAVLTPGIAHANTDFELRSKFNYKCLSHDLGGNGARVDMYDCLGQANQRWYWYGDQIRSYYNNRCLSHDLGGNGARVDMYDCLGQANQRWYSYGDQIRSGYTNRSLSR